MDIYIYKWIPGTRDQIVPGTRSARSCQVVPGRARSCQVPDRARYLIVPGTCCDVQPCHRHVILPRRSLLNLWKSDSDKNAT